MRPSNRPLPGRPSTDPDTQSSWHWNASDEKQPVHIYGIRLDKCPPSGATQRTEQSLAAEGLAQQMLKDFFSTHEKSEHRFERMASGRPIIRGHGAPAVSVSHSGDWVVCAMGHVDRLGIDIERVCGRDWAAAAPLALHPEETRWVMAADGAERETRALRCWTCKEVIIKAMDATHWAWQMPSLAFDPHGHAAILPMEWGPPQGWSARSRLIQATTMLSVVWQ